MIAVASLSLVFLAVLGAVAARVGERQRPEGRDARHFLGRDRDGAHGRDRSCVRRRGLRTPVAAHALDNPVWHSLTTQHAGLALTADGAARYPAAIVPFAGIGEPSARSADQLTSLVDDAESVFIVGVAPEPPAGWQLEPKKPVLQMICTIARRKFPALP